MRVIALVTLRDIWEKTYRRRNALKVLVGRGEDRNWSGPAELKSKHRTASILRNGRVVFNIGGNKYRLVAAITYKHQILFIKFIGTHKVYDSIDAQTIEHGRGGT